MRFIKRALRKYFFKRSPRRVFRFVEEIDHINGQKKYYILRRTHYGFLERTDWVNEFSRTKSESSTNRDEMEQNYFKLVLDEKKLDEVWYNNGGLYTQKVLRKYENSLKYPLIILLAVIIILISIIAIL